MRKMWHIIARHHALIPRLINSIYPSACPVCENQPDNLSHAPICNACWSQIKRYGGPSCSICALPFASEYPRICGSCLKKRPPFSLVIPFGLYEGVLADAISLFKFHGLRRFSQPLGKLLLYLDIPQTDAIIPVPLTPKGLQRRGFNQSLLIAKVIARKIQVPLFMDTLLKVKETRPQIGLSATERQSNLKNAFKVTGDIRDKRILLIDDVMTTGATVTECSKVLLSAGAKEILVVTLARAGMI
jgi:competence protein ComFC